MATEDTQTKFQCNAVNLAPDVGAFDGTDEVFGGNDAAVWVQNANQPLVKRNAIRVTRQHHRLIGQPHAASVDGSADHGDGVAVLLRDHHPKWAGQPGAGIDQRFALVHLHAVPRIERHSVAMPVKTA